MKVLITYYSYSGITAKAVDVFSEVLKKKAAEVKIQRLKPKKEITSFAGQCLAARFGKRCELEDGAVFDVSAYDTIILGLPVWAFAPAPAINTYLDKMTGANAKKFITLLTSGSGAGVGNCFRKINKILRSKGAGDIKEINIPNAKMEDKELIASYISCL